MILFSLNIRGIGGSLKAVAFRRVLDDVRPDIIFLQETLVEDCKARAFLQVFRPTWVACAVSSLGTSGGLLVAWDPNSYTYSPL
jgi:exonuclease III